MKKIGKFLLRVLTLALVTLLLAEVFSGSFTLSNAVLTLFNAAIVSLASNGGYEMMKRVGGADSQ